MEVTEHLCSVGHFDFCALHFALAFRPPHAKREDPRSMELIRPPARRQAPQLAVFDFDGTLSLIRGGWTDVMVGLMGELLRETPHAPDDVTAQARIAEFVLALNGKPTIFQMQRFAEEVRASGGRPETPEAYHRLYLQRLGERIDERKAALRAGRVTTDDLMVPGARALLQALSKRGVELTLASGTEIEFVRAEAAVLEIDHFFGGRIYGPGDDPRAFSKLAVMEQLIARHQLPGAALLGFGDGIVETENIYSLGGVAIGVASDELARSGHPEAWKRSRLIDAGAHVIVADYRSPEPMLNWLWDTAG
jgi:phosphoglycolate phosphatase